MFGAGSAFEPADEKLAALCGKLPVYESDIVAGLIFPVLIARKSVHGEKRLCRLLALVEIGGVGKTSRESLTRVDIRDIGVYLDLLHSLRDIDAKAYEPQIIGDFDAAYAYTGFSEEFGAVGGSEPVYLFRTSMCGSFAANPW